MKPKIFHQQTHLHAALALAIITALVAVTGVLAAAGALDNSFDGDGKVVTSIRDEDVIHAIAIQPDGKIVVAGESYTGDPSDFSLARYNINGSLDTSFDGDGKVITDIRGEYNRANAIALQSDGKIVVAGYDYMGTDDFAVVRYNANGSLDTTFDVDGIVVTDIGGADLGYAVAIQSDGKIVVAGASDNWGEYNFALARYNTNGSLDTTFDYDGKVVTSIGILDFAYAIAIQPDGKIIAAGESYAGGTYDFALARYNSNGSLDTTFDYDGKVVTDIRGQINHGNAIALQSDGKIIVAGTTGNQDFALVRYNSNGSLDSTFDEDGIVVTDIGGIEWGYAVAIQLDGKIVMAGHSDRWGTYDFALTRYEKDGSLDTSFDGDGIVLTDIGTTDYAFAMALQPDGKIVAAGESDQNYALARYDGGGLVFSSAGSQDGWVLESAENSDHGGTLNSNASTFNLGDDAGRKQYRSILSFNTAPLPDTAVITKVTLKLKLHSTVGSSPFTTHGNLLVDVRNGPFGGYNALQVGDFQAAAHANAIGTIPNSPVSGWYTKNFSSAIFTYINKAGVTQLRLRFAKDDNDDAIADYLRFHSGDSYLVNRPRLIIEYYMP